MMLQNKPGDSLWAEARDGFFPERLFDVVAKLLRNAQRA
jgi:hypothetical protein